MTINARIKEVRQAFGMSQTAFAEQLGATRGVISNLEAEKTTPSDPFIRLICREFHVREEWLRTGEGERTTALETAEERRDYMMKLAGNPQDEARKRLFEIASHLGPDELRLLAEVAERMARED